MYLLVFVFIGCVFILWYFVVQCFCILFVLSSIMLSLVTFMSVLCSVMFSFLYFSILVMFMSVQFFCICCVERNFFSLAVFGGNLLGDIHSSVAVDRHVRSWKWIGSIYLLTGGILWASACSLEAWGDAPLSYYWNSFH